jgi:hypothetical protein
MSTPTVLHLTTAAKRPGDAVLIRRTEALVNKTRLARGLPPLPPEPKEPQPKRGRGRPKGSKDRVPRKPMPPRATLRLDASARRSLRALVGLATLRQGKPVTLAEALTEALAVAMLAAANEHGAGEATQDAPGCPPVPLCPFPAMR